MSRNVLDIGVAAEHRRSLRKIVPEDIGVFRVTISFWPPARLPPLCIELATSYFSVNRRFRNYSSKKKLLMKDVVAKLANVVVMHRNLAAEWASSSLIVPMVEKAGV